MDEPTSGGNRSLQQVVTRRRGAKIEVYGFVGWVVTFVTYGCFLIWAYFPEPVLQQLGVSYYPSKYWAIAIPSYLVVAFIFCMVVYFSLILIRNAPLDSFHTITDEHASEHDENAHSEGIPPISDIPITTVNRLMFQKVKEN